jgi:hypothetical protein
MTPSQYAARYLTLPTMLDNGQVATVRVDKYLQNNGSKRNKTGLAAKDAIIGAMVAETKTSWGATTFTIDGWPVNKVGVVCVFMGKGSPYEISDALWLASRYGLIRIDPERKNPSGVATRTLAGFCDDCVGLDCNGFVNNFFSFSRDKSIDTYDVNYPKARRQSVDDVKADDVLVFVEEDAAAAKNPKAGKPAGRSYPHIALIDAVVPAGKDQLTLTLVQSSGGEVGLHVSTDVKTFANHGQGIFFTSGVRKAYVVSPPAGAGRPKV